MRIGIDVTFLFDQYSNRGIGTYGRELIKKLLEDTSHTWVLFGYKNLKQNLSELGVKRGKHIQFVSFGKPRNSGPLNVLYWKLFSKRKIKKAKLDVYFAPHFERGLPVGIVNTIVMMHDVIPLVTNSYSQKGSFINLLKGYFYRRNLRTAEKADMILTNSDFTKRELVQKAGFEESKVQRIHLGISERFRKANISLETRDLRRVLILYKISKPYLLYYGGLEANKNFANLLMAFQHVSQRHPDQKLVLAGKEFKVGWDNKPIPQSAAAAETLELINELKLRHKVLITGEIESNHLPIVLNNASAFVHLSTYEGFGFSVLEASAAGVPVITARRSSYPEILGDAPKYVNPLEPDKIAKGIMEVLQDERSRTKMIKAGIEVSEKYNWTKTAELTLEAMEKQGNIIKPLKLGYLISYFHPFKGGAESNALEIASRMVKAGHDVTVYTSEIPGEDYEARETYAGIKIRRFKRWNKAYYLGFYPGLFPALFTSKLDVLHVHGFGFIWHDFCLIFKKLISRRTKFINTPHGPFMAQDNYSLPKRSARFLYLLLQRLFINRIYSVIIQVNPEQYQWMSSYGINNKKIYFLRNGISEELLEVSETAIVEREYNLKSKFVITFIGRYEKYKGLEDLLRAVSNLVETKKTLKLIAMGRPGNYLAKLKGLVEEMNMDNNVLLLENPDDKIKERILEKSEIFVMPSQWEAFGISLLEAMAKGNAVISTRTEGGKFLVTEDENGFLYDYGDEKELENHLKELVLNKELRSKMQDANKNKAKEFTWESIAEEYNKFLKNLTR